MAKAETAPATDAAPKKSKKMLIVVILLVVLLLAAAGAAAFFFLKSSHKEDDKDAAHAPEPKAEFHVDPAAPPTFVPLEAFTVNLQSEGTEQYLQAMIVLKVASPEIIAKVNLYMPEIRHRINLLLSSKKPSEIDTIEGRETLANEIMIEANFVLGFEPPKQSSAANAEGWGPILSVFFNSFIIQ